MTGEYGTISREFQHFRNSNYICNIDLDNNPESCHICVTRKCFCQFWSIIHKIAVLLFSNWMFESFNPRELNVKDSLATSVKSKMLMHFLRNWVIFVRKFISCAHFIVFANSI